MPRLFRCKARTFAPPATTYESAPISGLPILSRFYKQPTMKLPHTSWEPIEAWGARNNFTSIEARDAAFNNDCIEWTAAGLVRYIPDEPKPNKLGKIGKSPN